MSSNGPRETDKAVNDEREYHDPASDPWDRTTPSPDLTKVTKKSASSSVRTCGLSYRRELLERAARKSLMTINCVARVPGFEASLDRNSGLLRVRTLKLRATGFLGGLKFHQLDARQVGIEEVELPLPVLSDFRLLVTVWGPAMGL